MSITFKITLFSLKSDYLFSKIIYVVFKDRKAEIFTDSGRRNS